MQRSLREAPNCQSRRQGLVGRGVDDATVGRAVQRQDKLTAGRAEGSRPMGRYLSVVGIAGGATRNDEK